MKILNFQLIENFEKEYLKHMDFQKINLSSIFMKMQFQFHLLVISGLLVVSKVFLVLPVILLHLILK
ncbi:hypothetical protein RhiirC2_678082 [Rhizophagus irregularis]|uniref:Uncharacterized protein n=1 Tax=Rhizophagus irregularis TaxID=588596 RepID=A0A2N1NM73_9GLOM|nr:hypothetical protein RhiirC2_678082 [Rhizophagus irregularis]